jgi:7 transmembrane receptor (rhodopsin family)
LQLWNRQNILILTLACADLTMSIGGVVFPLISAIHHEWIFGDVACEIYAFATSFVGK